MGKRVDSECADRGRLHQMHGQMSINLFEQVKCLCHVLQGKSAPICVVIGEIFPKTGLGILGHASTVSSNLCVSTVMGLFVRLEMPEPLDTQAPMAC